MLSLTKFLAEGFALGLAAGPQCLLSCAPLMVPFLLSTKGGLAQSVRAWTEFMLGRLAAYLVFAIAVGWLGQILGNRLPPVLTNLAVLAAGGWMLFYAFWRQNPRGGFCAAESRRDWIRRTPLIFGFLVGINICPPFVAGLFRVLSVGKPLLGMGYFCALYLGTSLYLVPLAGLGPLANRPRLARIGQLACILAGIWFTGVGLCALMRQA